MKLEEENYIQVYGWMRTKLHLKGNELLTYALIYGFSKDKNNKFKGSLSYITQWLGTTKKTAITALNSLTTKKLIFKELNEKGNIYKIKPSRKENTDDLKITKQDLDEILNS